MANMIKAADLMKGDVEEARKHFYAMGYEFFCWNGGGNTPNILKMLCKQLGELEKQTTALNVQMQGSLQSVESSSHTG